MKARECISNNVFDSRDVNDFKVEFGENDFKLTNLMIVEKLSRFVEKRFERGTVYNNVKVDSN